MNVLAADAIQAPSNDYLAILPELILMGTGLLILFMLAIHRFSNVTWYALIAFAGATASAISAIFIWFDIRDDGAALNFSGMISIDGFGTFLVILICIIVGLAILLSDDYLKREGIDKAEYYILMLFAASGMQFLALSNNLIMLFLSFELLSVCLYVLSAFNRDRMRSQEAGTKYLLLGAFSSAIMLYGIALVYGATGSVNFSAIAQFFANSLIENTGMVVLGMLLIVVGLGFKIAAVPFHMWTPDVYQGAPTPVVSFMAAGAKVAGFAGLFRVLETALSALQLDWEPVLWILAVLTMLIGSILAIVQKDTKRIIAYSAIATAGFILIGLVAGNEAGITGSLFYLFVYTFMSAGAFAVVLVVGRRGEQYTSLDDYKGLFAREPMLATLMTLFLLGFAGIPGTAGFVAKFSVFAAAADSGHWWLILIGAIASVVSLVFYLRLIVAMYMDEPEDPEFADAEVARSGDLIVPRLRIPLSVQLLLGITASATVFWGILPNNLLVFAGEAGLFFGEFVDAATPF